VLKVRTLGAVLALALVASASASAFSLAGQPNRATLRGSAPAWASSSNYAGAADAASTVGFRVYLGWKGGDAAVVMARAVSTPGSPSYGQYLSPAQFRKQFAPSQADVGAVQSWLKSQGFTIDYTPTNNHYVAAEGTVAQVNSAFSTSEALYQVAGATVRAPSSDASIPSSLADVVEGVVGLDESSDFVQPDHVVDKDAPPSAGFRNAPPCSSYWGQYHASDAGLPLFNGNDVPFAPCGATPAQLRGAYGIAGSGYDGSGQTVAVIDAFASPTIADDVNTYSANHGLPTLAANQLTQVVAPGTYHVKDNKKHSPSGWYGEETLDIEAVHAMAPSADIVYVSAPNNQQDMDAALNHVVDRGLAQIVTNSYGFPTELLPSGYVKPISDTLIQAAIEGIGVYFSSGDNGDELANLGFTSADWPAASPWVTAVGGTSLGVTAGNGYLFETGWGTKRGSLFGGSWTTPAFLYGGGGGTSRLFAQPSYQAGVVPSALASRYGGSGRVVPDVAMDGDPNTGMLVGQTQTFSDGVAYDEYRIGGTSLSSPLFAGIMALADQAAGHPHGFANPILYAHAGSVAFHDVTGNGPDPAVVRPDYINSENAADGIRYTVRTLNDTGTIHVAPGYDDVTGVGTPNGASFLAARV
jgi:subtilase family serine protease